MRTQKPEQRITPRRRGVAVRGSMYRFSGYARAAPPVDNLIAADEDVLEFDVDA